MLKQSPQTQDRLPRPAMNLARRAQQLAQQGGRHRVELLFTKNGQWLLIINEQVEDLGTDE